MNGLMMDYPLTLSTIFRRAEAVYPRHEIVWRLADKSVTRYTYGDFAVRARRLARALLDLGIKPGDRVATLGWNHGPHLEAYFGIPLMGGVLHTLNLRLHPDELAYIVNHAEDRAVLVDESLLPLWEQVRPKVNVPTTIVVGATRPVADGDLEYEALIAERRARARSARSRRARRRRDVLHDRHDRQSERRAVLAPRARAPHARPLARPLHGHPRTRRRPAGRADVPRQRLGHAVFRGHGRRQARHAGPAPRSGQPRRSVPDASASR